MKKIILYIVILIVVSLSNNANALDGIDECRLLVELIKRDYVSSKLDIPSVGSPYFDFKVDLTQDHDYYSAAYERDDDGNIYIGEIPPNLYTNFRLKFNDRVSKINGVNTGELSDEQVWELIKFDRENRELLLEIIDSNNQIRKVDLSKFDSEDQYVNNVYITFEVLEVDEINSSNSSYKAAYTLIAAWSDDGIETIGEEIYNLNLNNILEDGVFNCYFTEEQFKDLRIFEPSVTLSNAFSAEDDNRQVKYGIEYVETLDGGDLSIYKKIRGSATFKSDFDFRAFPFDAQKLRFEIRTDNFETIVVPSVGQQTLPYWLRSYENLNLNEWKKIGIDFEHLFQSGVHEIGATKILSFVINLERNFFYYLFKIYIPVIIVLLVSMSVFWINPKDIESRLTVSIVCLLSLIAYTYILDKDIPKLAYLTIMDYVILLSYFFSVIPTIESIYIHNYKSHSPKEAIQVDIFFRKYTPLFYLLSVAIISAIIITGSDNIAALFKF